MSYSKSRLEIMPIERKKLTYKFSHNRSADELKVIADNMLRELALNKKIFSGKAEMRRRIDIDSIIRCTFGDVDISVGLKFEVEGKGVTYAGGNIDYIVSKEDKRIGVIEAKDSIDASYVDNVKQLHHEMNAIKDLCGTSPSYVFGFLTDGISWELHLSNYISVVQHSVRYELRTPTNDVLKEFIEMLISIILHFEQNCFDLFLSSMINKKLDPIQSVINEKTRNLYFSQP